MQTHHIHINGIVQGVGFRPLVYQLAKEIQLNGYVKNGNDGVHIFFNATPEVANIFFNKIKMMAPPQAKIISCGLYEAEGILFDDFSIIVGDDDSKNEVLISPDKSICDNCRRESYDINNRRYRYPFITCTHCGPRYSIMNKLPYERHFTSMQNFLMCENCRAEYSNVSDRRFFSQTNSCAGCGIELRMYENASSVITNDSQAVLLNIKNFLGKGKIVAVKGIGGYLLLCDANDAEAIQLLRSRKHRPAKPFAVLYPGIEIALHHFEISRPEKKLLLGEEAPIVLLHPKAAAAGHLKIKNIAPGLKRLGVMLPYNPLLELIANDYGKPLIATSANISGSPIIYKDQVALAYLFQIADYVVSHNREIIIPQDDSVVQVTNDTGTLVMLRRSRGYAPSFLQYKPLARNVILATGAFLKSSFTIAVNNNVFVSQFLGSGESYESQLMYKRALQHWLNLYNTNPDVIIADTHPNYFSHQYAIELSENYGAPLKFVQHHEAHFAAVLAENNLIQSTEPVLGVIWDGTGLGTDGNIWGGEFFIYERKRMSRCSHFDYFPAIAGDKFALEPRIAALCTTSGAWPQNDGIKEKFTGMEWHNYQSLTHTTTLFSSSAGRIFDAVASLLNICDKQTYEGEAAMYLQVLAGDWVTKNGFVMDSSYFKESANHQLVPTSSLMQGIIDDIKSGKATGYIAAKFHYSLVCLVDIIATNINAKKICFSGGVFQNALLIDWIQLEYSNKYQLFFHKDLSPNDENISFGQLVYHDNNITGSKKNISVEQKISRSFSGLDV